MRQAALVVKGGVELGTLFSICIPTYNREKFLRNSLESLYRQIDDKNKELVEVLVSNNCSTDGTHGLVQEYIAQGMEITYFCNQENLGMDGNFLQCINEAKGKYVLLLGDDDVLLDGAIDTLLKVMENQDYGIIYVSGCEYENRDVKSINYNAIDLEKALCGNPNEMLQKESIYITFLSGNIFNKAIIEDFDTRIYRNTVLMQVPFYLNALFNSKKSLYFQESFIASGGNGDNNGGYGLYRVFGENLFNILNRFKYKGITDETINKIQNDFLLNFLPFFILIAKKKHNFDNETIDVLKNKHGNNWRFWLFNYTVDKLPVFIGEMIVLILRLYKRCMRGLV